MHLATSKFHIGVCEKLQNKSRMHALLLKAIEIVAFWKLRSERELEEKEKEGKIWKWLFGLGSEGNQEIKNKYKSMNLYMFLKIFQPKILKS